MVHFKPPRSKEPPDLPKPRSASDQVKRTMYQIRQRNLERKREIDRMRRLVGYPEDDMLFDPPPPPPERLSSFRQDLKAMKDDLLASYKSLLNDTEKLETAAEEHKQMVSRGGDDMAAKKAGAREPNRHRPDVPPGMNRPQAIGTALPPPEPETPSYRGGLAEEYMKLKKENEALKNKLVQKELEEIHTGLSAELAALDKKKKPNIFVRLWKWFQSNVMMVG